MAAVPKFSRRSRWAVPAGIVAAVAAVGIASAITVAQASPALPPRTPAQLLAAVAGPGSVPPLTGTVGETDFIRNGATAWLWESNSDSVTKILVPKDRDGDQKRVMPHAPLTPQQAA